MPSLEAILARVFALCPKIRYVALYRAGKLTMRQRADLENASASESDRYEELFVNPALLTLVRQRGNLDCGGVQSLLIRYGSFFQLVIDLPDGHASVCFELSAAPLDHVAAIRALCS